jgi:hypothetical protein
MGPKDDRPFEKLINLHGEEALRLAWALYVYADPSPYHLEPVNTVEAYTSAKTGRTNYNQFEDQSKVTKFPLAAFRAVSEAYVVEAMMILEDFKKATDKKQFVDRLPHQKRTALLASVKNPHKSLKNAWGLTGEDADEDVAA